MAEFAELLSEIMTVPLIDENGLDCRFSLRLAWERRVSRMIRTRYGDRVQEQLGLRTETDAATRGKKPPERRLQPGLAAPQFTACGA